MKLYQISIFYMSALILAVLGFWAVGFYFSIFNEIKDSVDEGLDNYKRQLLYRAGRDSTMLKKSDFTTGFFSIVKVEKQEALRVKDTYIDTMLYMQDSDDEFAELEPVRMLRSAFELDDNFYIIKIISPMIEKNDMVKQMAINISVLFVLIFISVMVVNMFVLRRMWLPFYLMVDKLKHFRIGQMNGELDVKTKTYEFNELQDAVNMMITHVGDAFLQQKQFVGDAAHELQTPLAILGNKIDSLMESGELNSSQIEKMQNLAITVNRMVRLNKSLLLLSKIDSRQFLGCVDVSINMLVDSIVEEIDELAQYKGVAVKVSHVAPLHATMDESLANVLISNIIRNSLSHNVNPGRIEIVIDGTRLLICNSGKSEPLSEDVIFNRFYKAGSHSGGSGLGLSIVKAICNHYSFTIKYTFTEDMHCFSLQFSK